jgi:beta-1,4-mannosyl-glycoprotein beta-1,4-N-acetylglucosaminyltransferase
MIIDAFTFFNELDLLEARLEYLYDTVDYFVIVESNVTFSGKAKPMYYLENHSRFKKFKNKIIWNPYLFDNSEHNLDFSNTLTETDYNSAPWTVEKLQRNHISEAIKHFDSGCFVLISDVDEIPHKQAIQFAKNNLIENVNCASMLQRMFYYNCGNAKTQPWVGSVFTTNKLVQERSPQWFRDNKSNINVMPQIYNGGWHLSYFGNVEDIVKKIESFSHQELNTDYFKNPERIRRVIDSGGDLFDRPWDEFVKSDISMFTQDFMQAFFKFLPAFPLEHEMAWISSAWQGHSGFATWLVDYINPECVVDLGVDYALSTFAFGFNKANKIFGIDSFEGDIHAGHRNTYGFVSAFKDKHKFDNITFIKGYFDDVALTWKDSIDILHIDGLHTYDAVKNDYDTWKKFLKNDSVILFHDTVSFPDSVGKFFNELPLYKVNFEHSAGLGVASRNKFIIDFIAQKYNLKKNLT